MHVWSLVLGVCLLSGCQTGEPPCRRPAPVAEDLSTWACLNWCNPSGSARQRPACKGACRSRREGL